MKKLIFRICSTISEWFSPKLSDICDEVEGPELFFAEKAVSDSKINEPVKLNKFSTEFAKDVLSDFGNYVLPFYTVTIILKSFLNLFSAKFLIFSSFGVF